MKAEISDMNLNSFLPIVEIHFVNAIVVTGSVCPLMLLSIIFRRIIIQLLGGEGLHLYWRARDD